jgi:hypothetical protein
MRIESGVEKGLYQIGALFRGASSGFRFVLYWLSLFLVSVALGKDMNWDLLNYHIYTGEALLHGRMARDFFPASVQSYLNPIPDLPFYLLLKTGLPSLAVCLALTMIHAFNLVILRAIAKAAMPPQIGGHWMLWESAVLLGGLAPLFLTEVGTSLVDVVVSLPCLLSVLLLINQRRNLLLSGAFAGAAVGMKLTALLFIAALLIALILESVAKPRWSGVRSVAWFCIGGTVGFLIVYGWWGMMLWQKFDNPFFPFFNDIFKSKYYPEVPVLSDRFLPFQYFCIFSFPVEVLKADRHVYFEKSAPDLRFLAAVALTLALVARSLFNLSKGWSSKNLECHSPIGPACKLVVICLLYYVIWFWYSANGRYAMTLLLLLGPFVIWLMVRLSTNKRWLIYAVSATLLTQSILNVCGADLRWYASGAWGGPWLQVKLKEEGKVKRHANMFLSIGVQSFAFLSAYLHKDSTYVNLVGQKAMPASGRQWARVVAMRKMSGTNVRTLYGISTLGEAAVRFEDLIAAQDSVLSSYGMRVDPSDCELINVIQASPSGKLKFDQSDLRRMGATFDFNDKDQGVVSCRIVPSSIALNPDVSSKMRQAVEGFAWFEKYCRLRVKDDDSVIEARVGGYSKLYTNSDTMVKWSARDRSIWVWRFGILIGRFAVHDESEASALNEFCHPERSR